MENAVDALHIGFGVLVFVIAISLAFTVFSQAREVADIILFWNDKTNFDEYVLSLNKIDSHGARLVGMETIIPSIRKYIHENDGYSITVKADGKEYVFDIETQNESGIITDSQLKEYCEKQMKEILKNYKNNTFWESYSESEYSGGYYEVNGSKTDITIGKGNYTAGDGETVAAVNTKTKVWITYTKGP